MDSDQPLLNLRGIVKRFPGLTALDHVDLRLERGEICALLGENGAGKSTLIKILTGVYQADEGTIELDGVPIQPNSPLDAQNLGIATVYQEVNLVPNLSVAENICLGREPSGRFGVRWQAMNNEASGALAPLGLKLDVKRPLGRYSLAIQQMVAIARALHLESKVLILDEPTSSLDRGEVTQLFRIMREVRSHGLGIVFVTHFLDQVYEVADSIMVLRNGKLVAKDSVANTDRRQLVQAMVGRDLEASSSPTVDLPPSSPVSDPSVSDSEPLLRVEDLCKAGSVTGVSFELRGGEVLGLGGLLGSGRTETLELLFGLEHFSWGSVRVGGKGVSRMSPKKAIGLGMALCPEDRKAAGIFPDLSVRENIAIVLQRQRGWFRPLSRKRQGELATGMVSKLKIATPDVEKPIRLLSGGNQQKAILARWLAIDPSVFLLDEPTRGIDVGAKFEIAGLIESLRQSGKAFVLVTSEFSELVRNCSRVLVLKDRRQVGVLEPPEISEASVMETIAKVPS